MEVPPNCRRCPLEESSAHHTPCGELTNLDLSHHRAVWQVRLVQRTPLRHCDTASPGLDHAIHAEREANKENRMEAVEIERREGPVL